MVRGYTKGHSDCLHRQIKEFITKAFGVVLMQNVAAWPRDALPLCSQMHPYKTHRVDFRCQFFFQVVL